MPIIIYDRHGEVKDLMMLKQQFIWLSPIQDIINASKCSDVQSDSQSIAAIKLFLTFSSRRMTPKSPPFKDHVYRIKIRNPI